MKGKDHLGAVMKIDHLFLSEFLEITSRYIPLNVFILFLHYSVGCYVDLNRLPNEYTFYLQHFVDRLVITINYLLICSSTFIT